MKKFLTILVLTLVVVVSQTIVWAPTAQAVPLSCQNAPNDPDCLFDLLFEFAFSEWNEDNDGAGIHGVGIF